jgi:hypothetical protein
LVSKSDETEKYGNFFHFRYTSSKDGRFVYAFLLIWPKNTTEITLGAPLSSPTTVVTLLGSSGDPLPWRVANGTHGIAIDVSNVKLNLLQSDWTWAFKLENLLPDNIISTTPEPVTTLPPALGVAASFHSSLLFSALFCLLYVRV